MEMDRDLKKYENLLIVNQLSEIIKHHTNAIERLERFCEEHPYLIAPNLFEMLRENLRDNQNLLLREFNSLQQSGREKKKYSKRYVCKQCHSVFSMRLPEGICDECRSRGKPPDENSD
jgi:hypothetical protein